MPGVKQIPNAGGPQNQGSPMMNLGQDGGVIANYYNPGDMGPNEMRGGPGGAPGGGGGNHALQDYQTQLMLFEQQNKKRLMMSRQEYDQIQVAQNYGATPRLSRSKPPPPPPDENPIDGTQSLQAQQIRLTAAATAANPIAHLEKEKAADNTNSTETPAKPTLSPTFALSEEFTFMFRECHTSDILQLLRDNWNHYSQWINGSHMKWQDTNFLESSSQSRNSLGADLVQYAKGSLPLQGTVLPMIDPQLDEGRLIPAVDIKDPQHPEWTLLSYFGVIMKGMFITICDV